MTDPATDLPGGFLRLRTCRHGRMLYNVNDRYIGRSLDLYGEFSEQEARLLRMIARPGDVVVEAGANIGALTVVLAQAVGPEGAVLAFEPQRIAHQMLCANLMLNGLTNVVARLAAAGAAPGTAYIPHFDPRNPNNFGDARVYDDASAGEAVPVETIDDRGLGRCRLIKADVQGMEEAVLRGATRTIAEHRPFLYVENDDRTKSPALLGLIRSMEYRMWWHLPPLFNPGNFLGTPENVFVEQGAQVLSCNVLCVPREIVATIDLPEIGSDQDWPDLTT